jgi:hypothetical protein
LASRFGRATFSPLVGTTRSPCPKEAVRGSSWIAPAGVVASRALSSTRIAKSSGAVRTNRTGCPRKGLFGPFSDPQLLEQSLQNQDDQPREQHPDPEKKVGQQAWAG